MGRLLLLLLQFLVLLMLQSINAQPSPGYYPSSRIWPMRFYQGYSYLWGPQHQSVSQDQSSVTIWLDRSSGLSFLPLAVYDLSPLVKTSNCTSFCLTRRKYLCRKWIQVESPLPKWLLRSFDQAPRWLHCRSEHSFLCMLDNLIMDSVPFAVSFMH